ncbi:MAG: hypothetical protein Q9220_005204 [cf. Caloplaca sp. 1 TL-2023]
MPQLSGSTKAKSRDGRQSRSRNTTPSSNISVPISSNIPSHTAYLEIDLAKLMIPQNVTYDQMLNQHGGSQGIPDPSSLNQMADNLRMLEQLSTERYAACDRGMRALSEERKRRIEEEHRLEQENRDKEEKASLKRAAEDEEARGRKSLKTKKVKKERSSVREERPLAIGAHGLARQDGLDLPPQASTETVQASPSPPKRKLDAVDSSSLSSASQPPSPTTGRLTEEPKSPQKSRASSTSSVDSHQPPPAASIAQYQTFGPDPTTFDDPTIYHIRPVTEDMTDEERAEIYSVAGFPHSDLSHMIAGTIPDKDFSNAKPSNQVNANTFQAYIDPYLRPLTEEEMAFLKERGDRVTPFLMPRRGKRHYSEIWAEEDGQFSLDSTHHNNDKDRLPLNQARGNLEQMTDEIAETDQISNGPMLNRLLSTMRFENRPSPSEDKPPTTTATTTNGTEQPPPTSNGLTNGDVSTNTNGHTESSNNNNTDDTKAPTSSSSLPPATYIPSAPPTNTSLKLDPLTIDDRLRAELRYIGFLPSSSSSNTDHNTAPTLTNGNNPPTNPPATTTTSHNNHPPTNPPRSPPIDYDAHNDDPLAERLRALQSELHRTTLENGARKSRLLALASERMAYQEYSTILEDLDAQVQQAYLKRTRTLGKRGKSAKEREKQMLAAAKRAAANGGGDGGEGGEAIGVQRPGIGDLARQLMRRRGKWVDMIAPVFAEEGGGVGEEEAGGGRGEAGWGGEASKWTGKGVGMGKGTIFEEGVMEGYLRAEKERWEDEEGEIGGE